MITVYSVLKVTYIRLYDYVIDGVIDVRHALMT